jgi:hypothetical protein
LSPIVWSSRPRLLGARRFWTLFALQAALIRARRVGFLAVLCRLGASDCRAVLFKSPICECCIHIMGFGRWARVLGGLPAAPWVRLLFLRCWPFLAFLSVCLRCPCAGRHLLFFAAAKKSRQKKAGLQPLACRCPPLTSSRSGPRTKSVLAPSPLVTRQSSVPALRCAPRRRA